MSEQYPGGFITKSPPTPQGPYETDSAYGIWNLSQQSYYQSLGLWPDPANTVDAQFNYVTMLLHGDGTNGAQNNTFLDSSTNNFTITRNGNTTQGSFSPYGSNLYTYFPGPTSGHFTVSPVLSSTGDFTLECWANVADLSTDYCISSGQYLSATPGPNCQLMIYSTGEVFFYMNGFAITTSGAAITPNTWVHIAAVRSGTTITVYVNGVSKGSGTSSGTYDVYCLGAFWFDSNAGAYQEFKGYLSNLRLTNTAVYTSSFTPSTTPLTAISGTRLLTFQNVYWKDNSTNNYPVSPYGGVAIQRYNLSPFTPYSTLTAYSTATIGGSGYFDGTGDYLTVADNAALEMGSGDFTMEAWVCADTTGFVTICSKATASGVEEYEFYVYNKQVNFYASAGSTWNVGFATGSVVQPYSWNHIAATRNGSTWTIWVNGVSQATATASFTISNNTTALGIGAFPDGFAATNGYFCDFRLVKGTALYTTAFTPPTAPLTAVSGTSVLCNFQNGAIYDNAMMNDLETVGNAQISTSVKKYGTGSLAFDGSSWLYDNDGFPNFGTGDFTVEMWVYRNSTASGALARSGGSAVNGSTGQWMVYFESSNSTFYWMSRVGNVNAWGVSSSSFPTSTWVHVAVVRQSGVFKVFFDGVSQSVTQGSFTDSTNYSNAQPSVGGNFSGYNFNGYIDDLRITNGYARYTANFTPPTQAFPNIGP